MLPLKRKVGTTACVIENDISTGGEVDFRIKIIRSRDAY